jgi:outer membrane protein assembly factor BamE (lipoprotein component of BamABCDE complex)
MILPSRPLPKLTAVALWCALAAAGVAGCDAQRIERLEEGVATEADVRRQFGEPVLVTVEPDGTRVLEYPRQPEGQQNYRITIGTDGRMAALRPLLHPGSFAQVTAGMDAASVRTLLGPPAAVRPYAASRTEMWEWRWLDGAQARVFQVTFDATGQVQSTAIADDPRLADGASR